MGRTTTNCPCKGCTDRAAATKVSPYSCHMNCERYNKWRFENTAAKYTPDAALDMQFDTINKIKRQQHLKKKR